MSVAFFKGLEIISLYKSLLMQKNMQDRLKRVLTIIFIIVYNSKEESTFILEIVGTY